MMPSPLQPPADAARGRTFLPAALWPRVRSLFFDSTANTIVTLAGLVLLAMTVPPCLPLGRAGRDMEPARG